MSVGPMETLVILAMCLVPLAVIGVVVFFILWLRGRPK